MKRAAVYVRISQDREGAGLGVERQRQDCRALAEHLGWQIVSEHTDNDVSAYSGKARPGYRALLEEIAAGTVQGVLAWHTDRLHRSPRELEEYVDLCEKHKIITHTVQAGELDLATPAGRAVARTLGAWARYESEHKSARIKRAQLQGAQAGRWLGGARPFGWDLRDDGTATLNRPQAREVQKAAAALLAGASLGSIVADLNRRGITTSTGRKWNYTSLRQVLRRPRNAGLSTLNGEIVGRTAWPVILTEETWRSLCAIVDDPSRRRSTTNKAKWLLAGIAVCGVCGASMRTATTRSNPARGTVRVVYRCRNAGTDGLVHVARSADPVDDLVTEVVLGALSRPDWAPAFAEPAVGPDGESLRVEAVSLRARLGEAADQFAAGNITGAQIARITEKVQARLAEVEDAMARASRGSALAQFAGRDPAKVWGKLDLDRRRAVIREVMTVTILGSGKRGNAFDPELVKIEWKGSAG